ncbi:MAG: hypothetical protein WAP52_02050 [Candidatus Sungiibacteriota bacterium]
MTKNKPYAILFSDLSPKCSASKVNFGREKRTLWPQRKAAEMGSFTKNMIRFPLYRTKGIGIELIGIEEGASLEKIEALCQKFNEAILPQLPKGTPSAKIVDGFETVQLVPQVML